MEVEVEVVVEEEEEEREEREEEEEEERAEEGGGGAAADMAAGRGMLKSRGAGVKKCKSQGRR